MKTSKLTMFAWVFFALALTIASCSESATGIDEVLTISEKSKQIGLAVTPGDSCDFSGTLSDQEMEGLLVMREEEKLARDVYLALYEMHGHVAFKNISKSEDAHMNAVLRLIEGFGLTDPAKEAEGEFTDDLFNTLYTDLVEQGSKSLSDALKVGAFIEEYDIADLEELLEVTNNETIERVYGNLLMGSKNHIRAFNNALNQIGETYAPTIISQDEYDTIIESSSGNQGNGNGKGSSGKNGNGYQKGTSGNQGNNTNQGNGVCDGTGQNT